MDSYTDVDKKPAQSAAASVHSKEKSDIVLFFISWQIEHFRLLPCDGIIFFRLRKQKSDTKKNHFYSVI